jgi:hypothetical protein
MSVDVTPSVGSDSSFQVGPIPHRVNGLKQNTKFLLKMVFTQKINSCNDDDDSHAIPIFSTKK